MAALWRHYGGICQASDSFELWTLWTSSVSPLLHVTTTALDQFPQCFRPGPRNGAGNDLIGLSQWLKVRIYLRTNNWLFEPDIGSSAYQWNRKILKDCQKPDYCTVRWILAIFLHIRGKQARPTLHAKVETSKPAHPLFVTVRQPLTYSFTSHHSKWYLLVVAGCLARTKWSWRALIELYSGVVVLSRPKQQQDLCSNNRFAVSCIVTHRSLIVRVVEVARKRYRLSLKIGGLDRFALACSAVSEQNEYW